MTIPQLNLATLNLHNGAKLHDTGQYFCNQRQFALPTNGNKVEILHSGKHFLVSAYQTMQEATRFIWMADWQMAYDVELDSRGDSSHPGRLSKVIQDIISKKAVQIRVLLYRSIKDEIPGTFDGLVTKTLNALNKKNYPGKVIVLQQASTSAQNDAYEYSHHQKFMVVDGGIAFIGGMDFTHGRYETPEFDVVIDPWRHVINDMYNPGASKLRTLSSDEQALLKQGFAPPYGGKLLEEGCQARMPWQDVHIKIIGPSVVDIHRNFTRRWNACLYHRGTAISSPLKESIALPSEINNAWLEHHDARTVIEAAAVSKPGKAMVQIVRSVSSQHLKMESREVAKGKVSIPDDVTFYTDATIKKTMVDSIEANRESHQANILNAMVNCIASADNYVYIETQFFISDFGDAGKPKIRQTRAGKIVYYPVVGRKIGNENDGIKNTILDALANRIAAQIAAGLPFHVYLVLPVHPEGNIADGAVWKQHWLALASIYHGTRSLIKRVQGTLKQVQRSPDEWKAYLTVLNMRNYGVAVQYARDPKSFREDFSQEIGRFVITEQIYVHSKLLIVDDAVAIIGSANINDRSLTGNGDTEIAAVVVDDEGVELRDLGSPQFKVVTRKFARELRRSLWEKHFGFALDDNDYFNTVTRASRAGASENKLPSGAHPPRKKTTLERFFVGSAGVAWQTVLDKPCDPNSIKAIQKIAISNAEAYEDVFLHTPRDGMKGFEDILGHFIYPYPVLSESLVQLAVNQAESIHAAGERYGQGVKDAQRIDTAYRERLSKAPEYAGKEMLGIEPPPLQAAFMTAQLEPHQQAGAQTPMNKFGSRYITYDGGKVHDVAKAITYLKEKTVGFFVAMPLNWGEGVVVEGDPTGHGSVDIGKADTLPKNDRIPA